MPTIVHLTTSTFLGGPERQMLGLATQMPARWRTLFASFSEDGLCLAFLDAARRQGHVAKELDHDTPRLRAALRELSTWLTETGAEVLCCHGYKADLLGRLAARRAGIPVVAVSRGWTGENRKVRCYEALDRWCLRWMDRVVCVSEGQAVKVRRAGVREERLRVIRNSIRTARFGDADPKKRQELQDLFPRAPRWIVGAAGRLSPEKGFGVLIEAAAMVLRNHPEAGFVLFGEGVLRPEITRQIHALGLSDRFMLPGFRDDLDTLVPCFDMLVLPSFTEGLPNVVLEACAAAVPVVATAVGGTPEVIGDGGNGFLVPPGDPCVLAERIATLLGDEPLRRRMGQNGLRRVRTEFTFAVQAQAYQDLFEELLDSQRPAIRLQRLRLAMQEAC